MRATIAICTYNRSDCLEECIRAVFEQQAEFDYEVIVVDNNSTDGTKSLVNDLQEKYPSLRYVMEANQGLSFARNRALNEAKGDIVAFIDDDGVAEPGWIAGLVDAFVAPDVACAGGKIILDLPSEPPSWLDSSLYPYLSAYDGGPEAKETEEVYGCNFAVHRSTALELGGFSVGFGFTGENLLPGEDIDYCLRVRAAGHKVMYTPSAIVRHKVSRSRLTKEWFLRRTRQQGRAAVLIGTVPKEHSDILKCVDEYADTKAASFLLGLRGRSDAAFHHLLHAQYLAGQLDEMLPGLPSMQRRGIIAMNHPRYCASILKMILRAIIERR